MYMTEWYTCHSKGVQVRGQFCGDDSLLPPSCGFQGRNQAIGLTGLYPLSHLADPFHHL